MELLTGKAREHFTMWLEHTYQEPELFGGAVGWDNCYTNTYNLYEQDNFPVTLKAALITEWFRDVNRMVIEPTIHNTLRYWVDIYFADAETFDDNIVMCDEYGHTIYYDSYTEALQAAISKANDIYNAKHQ